MKQCHCHAEGFGREKVDSHGVTECQWPWVLKVKTKICNEQTRVAQTGGHPSLTVLGLRPHPDCLRWPSAIVSLKSKSNDMILKRILSSKVELKLYISKRLIWHDFIHVIVL